MPALADVYAREIPFYNTRHLLKPGLSGWAQIKDFDAPRGGVDIPRTTAKLSHDLYYLARRSLFLDIQIALKTLSTIVMRTGA
jgi:lipopolysaccharide/colanic/teichoic acid biosynthesis glycosyltransferase